MEMRHIETFLVLCDELHFARTAKRLYLTQSRVSQLIRELEREIGAPLFERSSRRVTLMPVGDRFRAGARRAVTELRQAVNDAQDSAQSTTRVLRVGYQESIRPRLGTQFAATFEERYPHSQVVLSAIHGGLDSPFTGVRNNDYDVALIWSPQDYVRATAADDLSFGPVLQTDERAVLVAEHHPLAHRSSVTLDDLVGHELLLPDSALPPAYRDAWTPPNTPSGRPLRRTAVDIGTILRRDTFSIDDMLAMLARSNLAHLTVASLSRRYDCAGLALVPIIDLPPCFIIPMWSSDRENACIRAFVHVAEALATPPTARRRDDHSPRAGSGHDAQHPEDRARQTDEMAQRSQQTRVNVHRTGVQWRGSREYTSS